MNIVRKTELYFKSIIRGQRQGLVAHLVKMMLLPLSWIFGLIVIFRNWLYDTGWLRRYVPPVPLVISIGNIVAGGTGKTPVTLLLAKSFYERFPMAILSRGYRSKAEKLSDPIMLSEGYGPLYPASYCGDEPYIFAQRLPKSYVIVGGDRQKASYMAAKAGCQIILLDDAMQHRRLARDLDIVVIDISDTFGLGYFLPRGFLREDIRSLSRAHLIILNHIKDQTQFENVKSQLSPYTKAPVIGTKWHNLSIRDIKGQSLSSFQGKKVGLFCGIAHPEYFRKTVEQQGCEVVAEYHLADHDELSVKSLELFSQSSLKKGAEWLVCTEKDRVKLKDAVSYSLPVAWFQMDLDVVEGKEIWAKFIKEAEAKIF
jgi:tetraacyldisaccharide 4'-kinase